MTQRFIYIVFSFLLIIPLADAQISIDQIKASPEDHHHTHQDSSFHCGMCEEYLFDSHEATKINDTQLHYHGIGTDDTRSAFHCSACKSHIGYFNKKQNNYQVISKNLDKKDSGKFHCLACQMPLFDQEALGNSKDGYHYFNSPINNDRVAIDKRNKFYKETGPTLTCKACGGRLGGTNKNSSTGFGIILDLNRTKKKIRNY